MSTDMSFGKQEETQQLGNPPSHHIRLHPENQELNEEFGKAVSNLSSEFENELSGEEDEEEDDPSKRQNPLVRLIVKLTKKQSEVKKKDLTLDMFQPSRYKPNDLDQMAEDTKFSKLTRIFVSPIFQNYSESAAINSFANIFPYSSPMEYGVFTSFLTMSFQID
ncbi:unnamed protein product [Lepeophtheirus salmonis]|uniref:(salmon louse) hypothetical protein n=1 Tax=Lepeophtheirus salmonis TaxID=72036 RepID=A0A7R8HCP6_LEPSM|nr:unnamed protein product [Lepeophtheirus salmonis]CAF3006183.1 unnamed protein product [Lepeophtheirus salmonis]